MPAARKPKTMASASKIARSRRPQDEKNGAAPKSSLRRTARLPLLPIRDQVYFPHMIFPLLVGREKSVRALEEAVSGSRQIMLAAQKRVDTEEPSPDDLYTVGIMAEILQVLRVPDG